MEDKIERDRMNMGLRQRWVEIIRGAFDVRDRFIIRNALMIYSSFIDQKACRLMCCNETELNISCDQNILEYMHN